MLILLFLVVEHTLAKAFEIGVGDLIFEFLAHTLCIICLLLSLFIMSIPLLMLLSIKYNYINYRINLDKILLWEYNVIV